MQTVVITQKNTKTGAGHSSKGNQLKWYVDGWWYKADAFGYESLAETVVSHLLQRSNITEAVLYEPVWIEYEGRRYRGCRSRDFRRETEELITLERLARAYTSFGLADMLSRIAETRERISYTEELVRHVTGITDFGFYLLKILEMDAFFLNEDRHTNNIALLYDTKSREYRLCPFFDMGLSMFSDTREEYPPHRTLEECRTVIRAKPFHRDFDEQLDAANRLYGNFLKFDTDRAGIAHILEELNVKYGLSCAAEKETQENTEEPVWMEAYKESELARAEEVLRYQERKYRYMFT